MIRQAMAATGTVGIARLVLYRRERAVMLAPRGKGIVVWTLRYGDEVRDEAEVFGRLDEGRPEPQAMRLMTRLIEDRTRDWSAELASDPVQAGLLDLIASRRKGRRRPPAKAPAPAETAGNVVDIMEALKKSLAAETDKRRK